MKKTSDPSYFSGSMAGVTDLGGGLRPNVTVLFEKHNDRLLENHDSTVGVSLLSPLYIMDLFPGVSNFLRKSQWVAACKNGCKQFTRKRTMS